MIHIRKLKATKRSPCSGPPCLEEAPETGVGSRPRKRRRPRGKGRGEGRAGGGAKQREGLSWWWISGWFHRKHCRINPIAEVITPWGKGAGLLYSVSMGHWLLVMTGGKGHFLGGVAPFGLRAPLWGKMQLWMLSSQNPQHLGDGCTSQEKTCGQWASSTHYTCFGSKINSPAYDNEPPVSTLPSLVLMPLNTLTRVWCLEWGGQYSLSLFKPDWNKHFVW